MFFTIICVKKLQFTTRSESIGKDEVGSSNLPSSSKTAVTKVTAVLLYIKKSMAFLIHSKTRCVFTVDSDKKRLASTM